MVQNDRVSAILSHRAPRSIPELASPLATLQCYQHFLPLMKRLAIPLYKLIKDGTFVLNLLYLMGLQIRNHIFDPGKPCMAMADTSALETSLIIFQWDSKAFGVGALLAMAKPYLFQSTALANFSLTMLAVFRTLKETNHFQVFYKHYLNNSRCSRVW